jgi:hypothetical protein
VDAVASIRVVPEQLDLSSGQHSNVHVWAGDHEVATQALRWEMANPNIAVASGTTVYAGYTPGESTLTARVGEATATVKVRVRPANFALRVRSPASSLKRGEIGRVVAEVPAGLAVEWSSSNKKVLEALRDGTYYARSRGVADACALRRGRGPVRRSGCADNAGTGAPGSTKLQTSGVAQLGGVLGLHLDAHDQVFFR